MSVKLRIELERRIFEAVVREALDRELEVSVHNGEEYEITRSTSIKNILKAHASTDEDVVEFYKKGQEGRAGWVQFIYGNGGYDVISNYSSNPIVEKLIVPAEKISKKYE